MSDVDVRREQKKAACRKWYQKNAERERARSRAYQAAHRAERTAKNKAWLEANPEKAKHCHHCNVGLGHAKDNIDTLKQWVEYLERHQCLN